MQNSKEKSGITYLQIYEKVRRVQVKRTGDWKIGFHQKRNIYIIYIFRL